MTEEELFQHVCGKELAETNLDKIESEVRNINIFFLNHLSPLNANPTKWSSTLKTIRRQFTDELFDCV